MMFNSFRTQSMPKLYQTEQLAANLTELAIHKYIHAHTHTHSEQQRVQNDFRRFTGELLQL